MKFLGWVTSLFWLIPRPCHLIIISLCFDMYTVETTGNNFFPLFRQPSISTIVETVSIPQFRQPHVSTRRNCGDIFRNTGKKLSKHWDVETLVCRNNGITPIIRNKTHTNHLTPKGVTRKIIKTNFHRVTPPGRYSNKIRSTFFSSYAPGHNSNIN